MPFQGILKQQLLNPYFNHFKKVEVQVCEVGALSAPFGLAQQWVGIT
jgi:hypothetical protein